MDNKDGAETPSFYLCLREQFSKIGLITTGRGEGDPTSVIPLLLQGPDEHFLVVHPFFHNLVPGHRILLNTTNSSR